MGNKFCKIDDSYIVTSDKSFANCIPDKHYSAFMANKKDFDTKPGDVLEGKCMYYDTNAIKNVDYSKLDNEGKGKLYWGNLKDTGMKCVMINGSPLGGGKLTSTTGTIPAGMSKVQSKPNVSQKELNDFENNYPIVYDKAIADKTYDTVYIPYVDKLFGATSTPPTTASATPAITTTATPAMQQVSSALQSVGNSIQQNISNPSSIKTSPFIQWTMYILVILVIFLIIAAFISMLIKLMYRSPYPQYGGKAIKKIVKRFK